MITNERQHRITAAETKRFERAIAVAEQDGPAPEVDPRLHEAMVAGMRSQLDDLSDELRKYEALRDGKIKGRVFDSLLALPDALIEGRIAGKLTQKQLGSKLGIPEQQIQRYEQMRYRGVGVERLQEVADALRIKLRKTIEYDVRGPRRRRGLTSAGATSRSGRAASRSSKPSTGSASKAGKQMAGRKTGKAAASAAGKTLASHSASRSAKKTAASDLAQTGNQKVTSKKVASAAARTLRSKSAGKTARKVAASDLSQAARRRKR